jgi:Ca2+-binding RTX toxin-like protein
VAILGKVQALSGLAYVITDSGQKQLQSGDVLRAGSKLVTAPDATVTLLLNNGQIVRIGGDMFLPLEPGLDQALVDDLNQQSIDKTFIQTILQAIENNEDIDALLEETSAGLSNSTQNTYGFNFVDLQLQSEQPTISSTSVVLPATTDVQPPPPSLFSTPYSQQLYGQPPLTFAPAPTGPVNASPVAQLALLQTFEAFSLLSGNMVASDSDGDALLFTLLGIPQPGFILNSDGSYNFDPQDAAYDQMAQGEVLTNTYLWEVSDGKGGVDSATLELSITGVNDAPVAVADSDNATEDGATATGTIASNDSDVDNGATLTYALDNTVAGLSLNADGSYVFDADSYDSLAQGATVSVIGSYTVSDEFGASDTSTLSIAVTGINDTPTLANAMSDQAGVENYLFSFTFPLSTFADIDDTDVLTYSATLSSGAALPIWLSFDGMTRTISGIPPLTASGVLDIRITATDPFGASVFEDFNLDIANLILGTTGNNNLIGTAGKDFIDALAGNDTLNGGLGADTLVGGLGNDIYIVDNIGDIVTENAASGTDTVQSSIDITLAANVENLTLTGTGDLAGTGNELNNSITGNAGNNTIDGGLGNDTMIGGAGNDTYIVNATTDVVTEAAASGTDTVLASASFTLGTNVEHLSLTGNANINATGNTLNNLLTGNDGNNVINGGTGADTMLGGLGNDTYVVDNIGDIVTENAAEGIDLVQSSIAYVLGSDVENLTLTGTGSISGTGNDLDNILTGNTGNNSLSGGLGNDTINASSGNDTLDGGLGADSLVGGIGNDVYVVDDAGDSVTELAAQGTDTVQTSLDHSLAANIENLVLQGSADLMGTGNDLNNTITGNAGNNHLAGGLGTDSIIGGNGNDTLDGGLGNDTMVGGAGDDTYIVNATTDVVTEAAASGMDTIRSSVTLTLGANVEQLVLTGIANINGTGNTLNNLITGNDGNNVINGGTGADVMTGGLGNDTYVVDNIGDSITEMSSGGTDLVQSSIAFTLGNDVENLTLTGAAGISGTGNDLDNYLTGNTGNNSLTGGLGNDTIDGNTGNDTMAGGDGDDTYIVNAVGDIVTENLDEGNDTIRSAVSLTLAANVEAMVLTGTANNNATGNTLANLLIGNSGNNTLNGLAGADSMQGGLGNDIYVIDDVGDVVTENTGEGTDTVQSSITYVLSANIENLTLTGTAAIQGTGNELNNVLTGNTGNNVLIGGLGNDTLNGGTGNDTMQGDDGDDVYVVNAVGDVVSENSNQGIDLIQSSVSIALLAANVENLTLTGGTGISAIGNDLDNILTGNTGNNSINGGLGNDTINAGSGNDTLNGGLGADSLVGGLGNDLYVIDDIGDSVTELAAQGTDTVQASISHTLALNVENLTLTGSAIIDGTGNDLNNTITGNTGSNVLSGGLGNDTITAGAGADTLMGGAGNDSMTGGGAGVDVFRWALADRGPLGIPDIDTITDFAIAPFASGGDVLDIRDLLIDEHQLGGVGNLDDYLHFEKSGLNTILHISHDGGFAAGYSSANEDVTINLLNADLVGAYLTDNDIIDNLLNSQKLLTDTV